MRKTLINFQLAAHRAVQPESPVGAGFGNVVNDANRFNNSGEHTGTKLSGLPFGCLLKSAIFAVPKQKRGYFMLIIDSKDCENIDKALKKYKKKFEKAKVLVQLRERQAFIKPSVRRRGEVLKAVYKQQVATDKFE